MNLPYRDQSGCMKEQEINMYPVLMDNIAILLMCE